MTDIIARQGARGPAVLRAGALQWAAAVACMMLVLLGPALWNGFPIIFPDTGEYLTRPIEGVPAMGRSALYGLFLYIGMPLAFWPVIVAQSAATVWIVLLTLRCHGLGGRPWFALGLTLLLAVATSLSWVAAQLMPDILFPTAVLALYLLAFRSAEMGRPERAGPVALVAVAIACHMAALGLILGLLAALWAFAKIGALPAPRLALTGTAAGAGIALCLLSSLAVTNSFAFTPGGVSFLFGRMLEDGIVQRYLNEHCPDQSLRLCEYRRALPIDPDAWLWGSDSILHKLGGWKTYEPEEARIIVATLKAYPRMHIESAISVTLDQFEAFRTEISTDGNDPTHDAIRDHAPRYFDRFMHARQQTGRLDVGPLNVIHVPAAILSMGGLVVALVLRRRIGLAPDLAALGASILLALVINAAICGVFSHAVDRYQSRLMPLATLGLVLVIFSPRKGALVKSD